MGRREKREAVSTPAAPLAAGRSTFAWPVVFVLIGIGSFYLYRTAVDENRVGKPVCMKLLVYVELALAS